MKNSKKIILIAAMLILLAFGTLTLYACNTGSRTASVENLAASCIRIHIRANSNAECDQNVKLAVRDGITAFLESKLENCRSKDDAYSVLQANADEMIKIADRTLVQNGYTYRSKIKMGKEHFPERNYDGYVFPEGEYDAVIISLGTGTGDNWWCVAFPPLCFAPGSNGEDITYKSWVKEFLDSLFN